MKYHLIRVLILLLSIPGIVSAQFEEDTEVFKKTIYTSTVEAGNYTTLLSALEATEMVGFLDGDAPFTIFAPSDLAFSKLSKDKISHLLLPENRKELQQMVTYFMVAGTLTASKIMRAMDKGNGTASFTTLQGKKIKASMEGIDIVLSDGFGNKARITIADGDQCNGVLHTIDSVILPKPL